MRDPCVYVVLCLDTNLEVEYSVVHLFNSEGVITKSRTRHGDHYHVPLDELYAALEWGADVLNDYFLDTLESPGV